MKLNQPARYDARTHEGGRAFPHQKPMQELERTVATCLLWEPTFYEGGNEIAERIHGASMEVSLHDLATLAVKARYDWKLRHVPLYLVDCMTRHPGYREASNLVANTLGKVIRRPDEATEFLAMYWRCGKHSIAKQVKKGLAAAFQKFTAYQLQKYANRDGKVKLRDVLFMTHPKPVDATQAALWKQLADKALPAADTWEVALSAGTDKKATWERLLTEEKLGYMALLMNLRNMAKVGVNRQLVEDALMSGAAQSWALPFRFVSAVKAAPSFANALNVGLCVAAGQGPKLPGETVLLIDVSGSMDDPIAAKSQLTRWEAAAALAALAVERSTSCRVFTFSNNLVEVPAWHGLPLVKAIGESQYHDGTYLARALTMLRDTHRLTPARIIVVTDEQTHDGGVRSWATGPSYLVNVAPYKPGLDLTGGWHRINGWSERILDYIHVTEGQGLGAVEEEG